MTQPDDDGFSARLLGGFAAWLLGTGAGTTWPAPSLRQGDEDDGPRPDAAPNCDARERQTRERQTMASREDHATDTTVAHEITALLAATVDSRVPDAASRLVGDAAAVVRPTERRRVTGLSAAVVATIWAESARASQDDEFYVRTWPEHEEAVRRLGLVSTGSEKEHAIAVTLGVLARVASACGEDAQRTCAVVRNRCLREQLERRYRRAEGPPGSASAYLAEDGTMQVHYSGWGTRGSNWSYVLPSGREVYDGDVDYERVDAQWLRVF